MKIYRNKKNKWAYSFFCNGQRERKVVGLSKAECEAVAHAAWVKIKREGFGLKATAKNVFFEDYAQEHLDRYSKPNKRSWRSDENYLKALVPFFKGKYLAGITPDDIEQFKVMRREEVKGPSVNRELSLLKTMMRRAHKSGKIDTDPAEGVRKFEESAPRARFLDDEEMVRFVDLAAPGVKPLFELALVTGMRLGELKKMRWSDLDFKSRTILIPVENAKSKKSRTIPMDAAVYGILNGLERRAETVFFNPMTLRPLASVQRAFAAVCRKGRFNKAGQEPLTFHGLRHSAISGWLRHGVDIVTAAKLAGHSDIRITAGYCHSSAETGRQAVAKIGELFTPKAKQIGRISDIEPSVVSVSRSYLSTYEGRLN